MALDEFGREIQPTVSGGGDDGAGVDPPPPGPIPVVDNDAPSRLYEALPTSRYDDPKNDDKSADGEGEGSRPPRSDEGGPDRRGGGGNRRYDRRDDGPRRSSGNKNKRKYRDHDDDDDGDDDDSRGDYGSDYRGGGGRSRHSRDRYDRRYRDRDMDDSEDDNDSSTDGHGQSKSSRRHAKPHPSTEYTQEAMLCEVVWKEDHESEITDKTDEEITELYDQYRQSYGLNYVRSFFNHHMDDTWFRKKYSPLTRYQQQLQENKRAQQEAWAFQLEMESSIEKNNLLSSSTKSDSNSSDPSFFVLKARLGGGIRHLSGAGSGAGHGYSNAMVNPIPASHVMKLSSEVLQVRDVPPYVTDEQLTASLMSHATTSMDDVDANLIVLHSGEPKIKGGLVRTCYLEAPEAVRKEIIQQLHQLDRGIDSSAVNNEKSGSHVPRKDETHLPKTLELEVECSDPYNRLDVDADGKGNEPEDRNGVTARRASVWVSTRPLTNKVQVLSPALSTKKRISDDLNSVQKLAAGYDSKCNIPVSSRLESLLVKAVPTISDGTTSMSPQDMEDALDVAVAYLRRVHLLSFYNGCTKAATVAEVFDGDHAASTIHLRLSNADEILEPDDDDQNEKDDQNEEPKLDLLVQRLNDSIARAISESSSWIVPDGAQCTVIVDEEVDAEAKTLEGEEKKVEPRWIEDHTVIEEGRARCSFHFCRKLFKDITFLRKHLLKKHPEFLQAEIAKCHDPYMMKAWDAQRVRPVPPVLVECGHQFGLVESPVIGDTTPIASDPEPGLWQKLEEERKYEEELAEQLREKKERQRLYREKQQREQIPEPSLDAPLSSERTTKRPEFVDVDDMQVETVEIKFDHVEVPVPQPEQKKKKKKRKLL